MPKPTKAQLRVLRAMRDEGTFTLIDKAPPVPYTTVRTIHKRGWIAPVFYGWSVMAWTITTEGRGVLEANKETSDA